MKKLLLSIATLATIGATAQTNLDFETWSNGQPAGWLTSNLIYAPITVTQANGNGTGSSIKITTDTVTEIGGTDKDTTAFAIQFIANAPTFGSLKFDYKTLNPGNDTGSITIGFWDNGTLAYGGTFALTPTPNWYSIPGTGVSLAGLYAYATNNNIATDSVYLELSSSSFGTKTRGTTAWFDNIVLSSSVGVYELGNKVNVKTYPNPTTNAVTFEIEDNTNTTIEIYTVNGALVSKTNTINTLTTVSLENQVNGTYIYRLLNEKGNIYKTGKLIKE